MGVFLLIYNSFLYHLDCAVESQLRGFLFFFPQLLCEDVTRSCWKEWPKKQQWRSWRFVCASSSSSSSSADCTALALCNVTVNFIPSCFSTDTLECAAAPGRSALSTWEKHCPPWHKGICPSYTAEIIYYICLISSLLTLLFLCTPPLPPARKHPNVESWERPDPHLRLRQRHETGLFRGALLQIRHAGICRTRDC